MKTYLAIILLATLLAGCGQSAAVSQNAIQTAIAQTRVAEPTQAPTLTLNPTPTVIPSATNTPVPTSTPQPTKTPTLMPTATATPKPIKLSGTGDSVVDIDKGDWAAIVKIKYSGGGNFAIWTYGKTGEKYDLIVNTVGVYSGTRPIDFLNNQRTARFEITASGKWEIEVLPSTQARSIKVPGLIEGNGDDVILLIGEPDLGKVDASKATRNFAIWAYSTTGRDLPVNKIAPYSGTIILKNAVFLDVKATGPWSIEITSKTSSSMAPTETSTIAPAKTPTIAPTVSAGAKRLEKYALTLDDLPNGFALTTEEEFTPESLASSAPDPTAALKEYQQQGRLSSVRLIFQRQASLSTMLSGPIGCSNQIIEYRDPNGAKRGFGQVADSIAKQEGMKAISITKLGDQTSALQINYKSNDWDMVGFTVVVQRDNMITIIYTWGIAGGTSVEDVYKLAEIAAKRLG